MTEKMMTLEEFTNSVAEKLARFLRVDADSEIVRGRMSEQDSIDVIQAEYQNHVERVSAADPNDTPRCESACAASCIVML